MSERECDRCHAQTDAGTRCKNRTCTTGTYCWIHLKKIDHLRVKPSQIPHAGLGLYTTEDIHVPRGQEVPIIEYTGEHLTKRQLDRRYPGDTLAAYAIQIGDSNRYIDARSTQSSVARYANDCRGSRRQCNATLEARDHDTRSFLTADRNIRANHEILTSYGPNYWEPAAHAKTTAKRRRRTKR